ncbi:MAG: hypothetical protein FJ395_13085 [Verrucomicrobia bacterium]|nr:hypothetical protein [Verrucomicrobiota bacterium]
MSDQSRPVCVFGCSSNTYADCVQKGLFGSNPARSGIKAGDLCFLYHYEVSTLFGVWRAECDGARNIVPKAWGGRFPFQVKVKLLTSEIVEIPKPIVTPIAATSSNGRLDNLLDAGRAGELVRWAEGKLHLPVSLKS